MKKKHIIWGSGVLIIVLSITTFLLTNVDTSLSEQDIQAIQTLDLDDACSEVATFEDELKCIRATQTAIVNYSDDFKCTKVSAEIRHEPSDFLRRGYGCCFDRSRFIEKALSYYGFDIRHVSIHELRLFFPVGYLEPGIPSHALSEVKTARGWMLVDSLEPFLGLDEQGNVYTTRDLRRILASGEQKQPEFTYPPTHNFELDYRTMYGLYSRHGRFYEPFVPLPDINWGQLLYNF